MIRLSSTWIHFGIRPAVHAICWLPLLILIIKGLTGSLGANPIEYLLANTGHWAFRFLLISLAITPLIKLTNIAWLILLRRPLGLFAFGYACIHLAIYSVFDQSLSLMWIMDDISQRPFILVGFSAWLMLLPLAATSTKQMRKRLKNHWHQLHFLVYPIALLMLTHYLWIIRADFRQAWLYGLCILLLFLFRLISAVKTRL